MRLNLFLQFLLLSTAFGFETKIFATNGRGPHAKAQLPIEVVLVFGKNATPLTQEKISATGWTISDFKAVNATNYLFKIAPVNESIWGENSVSLSGGVVNGLDANDTQETNNPSNVYYISFGASASDKFEDCFDIHLNYPDYKSGLYYITFENAREPTITYCDQETSNGGWTLFYANANHPSMTSKKSYNAYMADRHNDNLKGLATHGFRSANLTGMVQFELFKKSYNVMGRDIGRWRTNEYGYINFYSNAQLQLFLTHQLVPGQSCGKLPDGHWFTYRNSNGMNYAFDTLMNYAGTGYGWFDCLNEKPPETPGSNIENAPRHIFYNINSGEDNARIRGIFGFVGDNPQAIGRYFLRPRRDLQPPIPVLTSRATHPASIIPVPVTLTFSEAVNGLTESGITCTKCSIYRLVKSPADPLVYFFDVFPNELENIEISVIVKAAVCEDMDHLPNVESNSLTYAVTGDFSVIKFAPSPKNESCTIYIDNWKSKDAGYLYGLFSVTTSGSFRIGLSTVKSKTHPMMILELGDGGDQSTHNIIHTDSSGKETIVYTQKYNFNITSYSYTPLWFLYDNGKILIGAGNNVSSSAPVSFTDPAALKIQFAAYSSSPVAGLEYRYPIIGPTPEAKDLTVILSSDAPSPAYNPFYITLSFSRNILSVTRKNILVNGKSDWVSQLTKLSERKYTVFIKPVIAVDTVLSIVATAGTGRDVDGQSSKESLPLSISFAVNTFTATITPVKDITTIPVTVTLTFTRTVVDLTVDKIQVWNMYGGFIRNFRGTDRTFTFDITPAQDRCNIYMFSNVVHDAEGNGNEYIDIDVNFGTVTKFYLRDLGLNYPVWLTSWSSNEVGKIQSTFAFRGRHSLYIGVGRRQNDISNLYEVQLAAPSKSSQEFTGNRISKTVTHTELAYVEKDLGINPRDYTNLWMSVDNGNISVGLGKIVGEEVFLHYHDTTSPINIQYLSFTNDDVPIDLENITVAPRSGNSPSVVMFSNSENPAHYIPIWVTVTFSKPVHDFDMNDIVIMGGFRSNLTNLNTTSYSFELYPYKTNFFCGGAIPAGAAFSDEGNFPTLASNPFNIRVSEDIFEFDLDPMFGEFLLWYENYYSLVSDNIWAAFTAKGNSAFYVAFSLDTYSSLNLYYFLFDEKTTHSCKIVKVSGGKTTVLKETVKEIAKGETPVNIWARSKNGVLSMGLGTVVGESEILSVNDLSPLKLQYITWSTGEEPVLYSNIRVGEKTSGLTVKIEVDGSSRTTIPVTATITFASPILQFYTSDLRSSGCLLSPETKLTSSSYGFSVSFDGNRDCMVYLPGNKVVDIYGLYNQESNRVQVFYSNAISNFISKFPLNSIYEFYYDLWKAKDASEIYSYFQVACTNNALIALTPSVPFSETSYEIILGAQSNTEIRLNRITAGYTTTLLARSNIPVCAGDRLVPMWLSVKGLEKGKTISVGSGSVLFENVLLSYVVLDPNEIKQQYIMFSNKDNAVTFAGITVGPGSGDIAAPTVQLTSNTVGPTSSLPVTVTATFNEPVIDMSPDAVTVTHGLLSNFVQISASRYTWTIIPLSVGTGSAHCVIPVGVVVDMAGNGNEASNDFVVSIANSLFDFIVPSYQAFHYSFFYPQWKSSVAGEIDVIFKARGINGLCVGFTTSTENIFPIYELCIDYAYSTSFQETTARGSVEIKGISETFLNEVTFVSFEYKLQNGVLTAYAHKKLILEYTFLNENWKQLQFVSFTDGSAPVEVRSILITPFDGSSDVPTPTMFAPESPSTHIPVAMKLSFNIPVTGIYDEKVLTAETGRIVNFRATGSQYLFDYIPRYANSTPILTLLPNVGVSRKNISTPGITYPVVVSDQITVYRAVPMYNAITFRNHAWTTSRYGRLYVIFDVRCENDMTIILTETMGNVYPQYIITMGGDKNTRTEIQRIQNSFISSLTRLGNRPMCSNYRNDSFWIEQRSGLISIGRGRVLRENYLYNYTDPTPFSSKYVSFSSWDHDVIYYNIEVGPYDATAVEGMLYTEIDFPTNVPKITCFITWTQPILDFTISDIIAPTVNVNNLTEISKTLWSFDAYPISCGISEIYIPAGAVWNDKMIKNNRTLPLYIEWCNIGPTPLIYVPPSPSVDYAPVPVEVSFKNLVYGFTIEDFTVSGNARIDYMTHVTSYVYSVLVTPLDNLSPVTIQIKADQLNDIYGNGNFESAIYTLPVYASRVMTFNANESYFNTPIFLPQWKAGQIGEATITFEAYCTNDLYIMFSKDTTKNSDSYSIVPAASTNTLTRIEVGGIVKETKAGSVCRRNTFTSYWASFNKRVISFGRGTDIGKQTIISYTDTADRSNQYIGLSNWISPVIYRKIRIGPDQYMPPYVTLRISAAHYYTTQNPVLCNITISKSDVGDLSQASINITNGVITKFTKVSLTLYTFEIVPAEGINSINVVKDAIKDKSGRGNEASAITSFEYHKTALYGYFLYDAEEISEVPIELQLNWSQPITSISSSIITTNTYGYFNDPRTTNNQLYNITSFLTGDVIPIQLSIEADKVSTVAGIRNLPVRPFSLPPYAKSVKYNIPANNGQPFGLADWSNVAHNNIQVAFTARCTNGIGIGFARIPTEGRDAYEIVISGWYNTLSVIRRGASTPHLVEYKAALCVHNKDVPFWADVKNDTIRVGNGTTIGSNIIMTLKDPKPLYVKYVYFTAYTEPATIDKIDIGPKNLVIPIITVSDAKGGEGFIVVTASLSASGTIWCLPRLTPTGEPLRDQITQYGVSVSVSAASSSMLKIENLAGGARYDVWCYGEDLDGIAVSEANVLSEQKQTVVLGTVAYPIFTIYHVAGKYNSLVFSASLDKPGRLSCIALPNGQALPSSSDIISNGLSFDFFTANTIVDLNYNKPLLSNTYYDTYCYAVSISGIRDIESLVLSSQQTVITDGNCRAINGVVCGGHGQCNEGVCTCEPSYHGYACNVQCPGWDGQNDCSNHGTCNSYSGQCQCKSLFHGLKCDAQCPNNGVEECGGRSHGFCAQNSTTTKYECHCQTPYTGVSCENGPQPKKSYTTLIIICSVCAVVVLAIILLIGYYFYKKPKLGVELPNKIKAKGDLDADVWMYNQLS